MYQICPTSWRQIRKGALRIFGTIIVALATGFTNSIIGNNLFIYYCLKTIFIIITIIIVILD